MWLCCCFDKRVDLDENLISDNDDGTEIRNTQQLPRNHVSTEVSVTQPILRNDDVSTEICNTQSLRRNNDISTEISSTQPFLKNNDISTGISVTQRLINNDTSSISGLDNDVQLWFPKHYVLDPEDVYNYFSCDFKKWLKNDKLTLEPALTKYSYNFFDINDQSNPCQEYELYATRKQSFVDRESTASTILEIAENVKRSYSSVIQNDKVKKQNIPNDDCRTIEEHFTSFTNVYMRGVSILRLLDRGYIVNERIHLYARHWHTLIGSDKRQYCMLCNTPSTGNHRANSHHKAMLEHSKNKILHHFGPAIVREIIKDELYHCGVCNESVEIECLLLHASRKQHVDNINACKKRCMVYYESMGMDNQNYNNAVVTGTNNQNTVAATSSATINQQKPVAAAPSLAKDHSTQTQHTASNTAAGTSVKQQNTIAATSLATIKEQKKVAVAPPQVNHQNTAAVAGVSAVGTTSVKQKNTVAATSSATIKQQKPAAVAPSQVKHQNIAAGSSTTNIKQQNTVATTSAATSKQQKPAAVAPSQVKHKNTAAVTSTTNVKQQSTVAATSTTNIKQPSTVATTSSATIKQQKPVAGAQHKNSNISAENQHLNVKILKVKNNGFIINECHISSASWNATSISNPKTCLLCNIPASFSHIMIQEHKKNLQKFKFIQKYQLNLIRKMPNDSYHCAICHFFYENVPYLENHIASRTHEENFKVAREVADDILKNQRKSATPWKF